MLVRPKVEKAIFWVPIVIASLTVAACFVAIDHRYPAQHRMTLVFGTVTVLGTACFAYLAIDFLLGIYKLVREHLNS